ncbi:hypothetical protein [Magnetospirillum molischianum]|uniref:Uncharacterized protein n=1 Tax=Magnetospirillum molischianum DSM 120 TaxID=1150626 RepID=H8FY35_MAGML|nr:hypothetical protein [Magnetospirillum molischianum]CCG43273.1 hypothetical protein PHAMO_80064 [Magnetospirillum molischianum DSM 120]
MGSSGGRDWPTILRRRLAGLPDEEGDEAAEIGPMIIDFRDRLIKPAEAFVSASIEDGAGTPDAETVEILEELLERAKSGEVVGVLTVVMEKTAVGNRYDWFRTPSMDSDRHAVIGQLEVLKTWLAEEALDEVLGINDEFAEEGEE